MKCHICDTDNSVRECLHYNKEVLSKEQFLTELSDLLTKYNASIYCDIDGDTHCINERMCIDIDNKEVYSNNGWELNL